MHNHYTKHLHALFLISLILVTLAGCDLSGDEPSITDVPSIANVRILQPENPVISEGETEGFPLPNCDGTGPLRQSLGTRTSISRSVQVGASATVRGSGEVQIIPEVVKLGLEAEIAASYSQSFEQEDSLLNTIAMEAAANSHVVYVIQWQAQTYSSTVSYSIGDVVYDATYNYVLRVPKSENSYQVTCPPSDGATVNDPPDDGGDECPNDPNKTQSGTCGCGVPDTDSDGDGTADCVDQCDNDPSKTVPGTCGCNAADTDGDGDGTLDCNDQCPTDRNKTVPGACGCNTADTDGDGDGTLDCNDQCPTDRNKTNPGTCGCNVADVDSDGDGALDCIEECDNDPSKTSSGTCGCGVNDSIADADQDGICTPNDQCPNDPNKTQPGECGCGVPEGTCPSSISIPSGAVTYYDFNGSGQDSAGSNTAIIQGATFTTGRDGRSNSALLFDGVDDYVQLSNESAFDLTAFTIIIWLKFNEARPEDNWIISKGSLYGNFTLRRTGSSAEYWAGYASYVHVTQEGNWSSVASQEPLPIGEFFCWAITVDSSSFRSYINGQLARSTTNVSPPTLNNEPVYIGAGGYNEVDSYFRGVIDGVQIYNRVLSDSEVAQQCR